MQELKNCLGLRIKTDPAQAVFLFARYAGRAAAVLVRADIRPASDCRACTCRHAGLHSDTVRAGRVPVARSAICWATDKYV